MFSPTPLHLPPYPFKLSKRDHVIYIFDELRKKQLVLTPEEWVRQHFIQFLITEKKIPSTLIQIEGGLKLNQTQKRSDILIFDRHGKKQILIECKAPSIKISQNTFDQAARYNTVHQAPWLVVTNGLNHYYAKIDHQNHQFSFVEELPVFDDL